MTTYGRRGGTGATTGRSAETLVDPVSGATKRVFFGQRWLTVTKQDEIEPALVQAWPTKDRAQEVMERNVAFLTRHNGEPPLVHYVVEAIVR